MRKAVKPLKFKATIVRFDRAVSGFPDRTAEFLFQKPPHGDWFDRFSIYGTGYNARTKDAMEDIFELLPKAMSDRQWRTLGGEYVWRFRSTHYSFAQIGDELPSFLRRKKCAQKFLEIAKWELAVWKCFHAFHEDSKLSFDQLQQVKASSRFRFPEALRFFEHSYAVARAWLDREKMDHPKLAKKRERVVLYRKGTEIRVYFADADEFEVLRQLALGKTLQTALKKFPKLPSTTLTQWLGTWFQEGFLEKIY